MMVTILSWSDATGDEEEAWPRTHLARVASVDAAQRRPNNR